MMKNFFLALLFLPLFLRAEYYSKEKFLQKLQSPPPEWMMKQIHEELSPFYETGISPTLIDRTLDEVYRIPIAWNKANLVRIGIQDNVASLRVNWSHFWSNAIVDVLNEMAKNVKLPDLEFLFSVWDFYDNPSFLEKTYCPVFVIAKYKDNHRAIAMPEVIYMQNRYDTEGTVKSASSEVPWEKREDIPFWRGGTTDMPYTELAWDYRPRARLALFSAAHPDLINGYLSHPAWLDEGLHQYFMEINVMRDWQRLSLWMNYRYLCAVDGVSNPSCLCWEFLSGSTILKQESEYIQWFYNAIEPYVHYIPFALDCSDLEEKIHWLKEHQTEAKAIAQNAYDFAIHNLENEDVMLYFYLLLQEYAKLWRNG